MTLGSGLAATLVYVAAIVAIAFPLMALLFVASLEAASLVGLDLRNSLLGSLVGTVVILVSLYAASRATDVYADRILPE